MFDPCSFKYNQQLFCKPLKETAGFVNSFPVHIRICGSTILFHRFPQLSWPSLSASNQMWLEAIWRETRIASDDWLALLCLCDLLGLTLLIRTVQPWPVFRWRPVANDNAISLWPCSPIAHPIWQVQNGLGFELSANDMPFAMHHCVTPVNWCNKSVGLRSRQGENSLS